MEIKCPNCGNKQNQKPLKSWTYGRMIEHKEKTGGIKWGAKVTVTRYACKCGKSFNFFLSSNNKSWTIPKAKK